VNGALSTTLTIALFAVAALVPLRPRWSSPFTIQFALAWWMNELPFIGFWWLLAGTLSTLLDPRPVFWWWLIAVLSVVDALMLAWILARAASARQALRVALENAYGPRGAPVQTRAPWWRIVLLPIVAWRPDVRRVRNRRYGPARFGNLLDVYVSRRASRVRRASHERRAPRVRRAPMLLYLHGGGLDGSGFGDKAVFAHALMYRFAAKGWVCMSANYRMFGVRYAEQLGDAKDAIGWARAHASDYGGDPESIVVVGGSSGANLAAAAGLSGAPVTAVVGLYGYYGPAAGPGPGSLENRISSEAPPFLVVHGAQDSLVRREDARAFVERLRSCSRQPVVYAEVPGANHNFDFFPSLRFHAVGDGILRFVELTVGDVG
jgi:acetyl esterase/lipase